MKEVIQNIDCRLQAADCRYLKVESGELYSLSLSLSLCVHHRQASSAPELQAAPGVCRGGAGRVP